MLKTNIYLNSYLNIIREENIQTIKEINLIKCDKFTDQNLPYFLKAENLLALSPSDKQITDPVELQKSLNDDIVNSYYFLSLNEEIIGTVAIGYDKSQKAIAISYFTIFKEYQGQGLGKASLKEIVRYIQNHFPNQDIALGVWKVNTIAVNLYKSVGFKIIDIINDDWYIMKLFN